MTGLAESARKFLNDHFTPEEIGDIDHWAPIDEWAEGEIRKLQEHMREWMARHGNPQKATFASSVLEEVLRHLREGETSK